MQVMDEYWYMLGSNDSVKLEVHDLLYLIGNQAMESMGYEISAQEYLIILLLLGVFDSTGESRESQAVELTLQQLEADDSAISKHIKALEKLRGKAVEVEQVTEFAKLTAEEKKAIEKAKDDKVTEIVVDSEKTEEVLKELDDIASLEGAVDGEVAELLGLPGTGPKARRRGLKRVPSILPFIKPKKQGSVGTKYWDKAKIKSLGKREAETRSTDGWEKRWKMQMRLVRRSQVYWKIPRRHAKAKSILERHRETRNRNHSEIAWKSLPLRFSICEKRTLPRGYNIKP